MEGTLKEVEEVSIQSLSNTLCVPDKVECFFQPTIIGDGATARASLDQICSAAFALFLTRASSEPSQGVIVRILGETRPM